MNVNKQDPRLTAFALGELDDHERDAIEAAVEADPNLQELVKEIGIAANLAGLAFRQEDAPGLSAEQRQAILEAANLGKKHGVQAGIWRIARASALAAVLMLGLGAYIYWTIVREPAPNRSEMAAVEPNSFETAIRDLTAREGAGAELTKHIERIQGDALSRFEDAERETAAPSKDALKDEARPMLVTELQDETAGKNSVTDRLLNAADGEVLSESEVNTYYFLQKSQSESNESALTEAEPAPAQTRPVLRTKGGLSRSRSNADATAWMSPAPPRQQPIGEDSQRPKDPTNGPPSLDQQVQEVNVIITDTGADALSLSGIGGFNPTDSGSQGNLGGGGFGGISQTDYLYAQTNETGAQSPSSGESLQLEHDEARVERENMNGVNSPAPEDRKTVAFWGQAPTEGQDGAQSRESMSDAETELEQLAQPPVPPLVPSESESVPSDILSSVINAAPNPGPPAELPDGSDAKGMARRSYDIDGDGVLDDIPFYTKPDGSQIIDNTPVSGIPGSQVIDNFVITDDAGKPAGPSAGGGFGGGGFVAEGSYFGGQNGIGGGGGYGGGRPYLSENEARAAGQNINYNRFVGDGTKLSRNDAGPNSKNLYSDRDSYDVWGEDFRSNYVTGGRRGRVDDDEDDVRIYQAYIDADEKYRIAPSRGVPGTESYAPIPQKPFTQVSQEPLSTFSVDVDTASYANARRFLTQGQLPPPDAVRVEEMINYFDYEYAPPRGEEPISVDVEIAQCVWETQHRLARIALKAREVPMDDRGPANLVFLIDVSGSMKDANKLPLLKESMKALTRQLQPQDRVAIVTYRDAASIALSPTTVGDKVTIETAINGLHAKGSTNGAGGLELAFSVASQNVISGSINRVILATDGDFNVGETDNDRLVQLIRNSAATGVFLTVLGFGEGNLKDDRLETIADKGNGTYHYIDNYSEATRVLCAQVGATLATVAKDVKVQIEFNPRHVSAYRLIGYENRALAAADFNNDRKDAGEMGSGEAVTALYELVPAGVSLGAPGVDGLKYQPNPAPLPSPSGEANPETMTVKIRYKEPEGDASRKFEVPVVDRDQGYDQTSRDYRWAVAVAGFGSLLRHPPIHHVAYVNDDGTIVTQANVENPERLGTLTLAQVREIAEGANGYDPDGRRAEFISLVVALQTLTGQ